jgi:hypothetical protein
LLGLLDKTFVQALDFANFAFHAVWRENDWSLSHG